METLYPLNTKSLFLSPLTLGNRHSTSSLPEFAYLVQVESYGIGPFATGLFHLA